MQAASCNSSCDEACDTSIQYPWFQHEAGFFFSLLISSVYIKYLVIVVVPGGCYVSSSSSYDIWSDQYPIETGYYLNVLSFNLISWLLMSST